MTVLEKKMNPLLSFNQLPAFTTIKPSHAMDALLEILAQNRATLEELLTQEVFTWENLLQPLEEMSNRLSRMWSPVSHLNSVNNTDSWRDAYNACLPLLSEYATEMGQNNALYQAIQSIKASDEFSTLHGAQQKIIDNELRDFQLSGVALEGTDKKRFAQIQQQLSQLTTKFEENVLDATRAWTYVVEEEATLSGLPAHTIALAAQCADQQKKSGWVFTLDVPCYLSIMKFADSAMLRQTFYHAFVTRASDMGPNAGEFDNSPVMLELLQLRHEKAILLGFSDYAHYSLATKMANSAQDVFDFLNDLAARSKKKAESDFYELEEFARTEFSVDELNAWDIAYYSEKLLHKKYAINEEMLRPYFSENNVFQGMFDVVHALYGIVIKEKKTVEVWHDSVRFFEIFDKQDKLLGQFYVDLYARPGKRGGAWMDDYCGRMKQANGQLQLPVAYLSSNFTKAVDDKPALLTHDEVVTLFHEFGHGLHHLLTQVDYLSVSGINGVSWDAVELPSQFMENFCWQKQTVPLFAKHVDTGEALPTTLFDNMLRAKNFQSGLQMLRQIEFSLFDFTLHSGPAPATVMDIQELLNGIRYSKGVLIPPAFNRFQHSFSHIFAGGYAAGYYSYKWAEVLSADAFSLFEETGVLSEKTGLKFWQSILAMGGSLDAADCFENFRGRKPSVNALLIDAGIIASS
jgi:oligopeptidase A